MMITSSKWPYSIFSNNFSTALKTETVKCFSCTFYPGPRFTGHQFDAAALLKKILWRSLRWQFWEIWTSQICKISMRGSLNSWNQWINDQPLYQRSFWLLMWLHMYDFCLYKNSTFFTFQIFIEFFFFFFFLLYITQYNMKIWGWLVKRKFM